MNYPSHPHPHRRPAMPLVARAANAATAAYQRAMTSKRERLYQQEIYRLRREVRRLRDEVGRRAVEGAGDVVRLPSAETLRAARNLARKVIDAERERG